MRGMVTVGDGHGDHIDEAGSPNETGDPGAQAPVPLKDRQFEFDPFFVIISTIASPPNPYGRGESNRSA